MQSGHHFLVRQYVKMPLCLCLSRSSLTTDKNEIKHRVILHNLLSTPTVLNENNIKNNYFLSMLL